MEIRDYNDRACDLHTRSEPLPRSKPIKKGYPHFLSVTVKNPARNFNKPVKRSAKGREFPFFL